MTNSPSLSVRSGALHAAGAGTSWAIADEAMRRLRAGEPLLMLTLGDPDTPPHPAIIQATKDALDAGRTHYSPLLGEPALREAVAKYTGSAADNVVIVHGAQYAAFATASVLAGIGDEIIFSDPYYPTYPSVVAGAGATMITVPAADDFSLDVEAILAAITPATRAIFLNSPCNPTGAALTKENFVDLARICAEHDIWLVVDEVYADFRFDGKHIGAWAHGPKDRTIIINSFSKSFAMAGFRIGWIIAPAPIVEALLDWTSAALFGINQFVQDGAVAALNLPRSELVEFRGGFARRAQMVVERIQNIPGLSVVPPKGGMFVMLNHSAIDHDDQRFARTLLDKAGVAVIPGSSFGERGRGHIRISLTPDEETLATALDRIAVLCKDYRLV